MELYFLIMAPIFASLLIYLLPERVAFYLNALVHAAMFSVSVYLFRCVRFSQEVIVTRTGADQFLNMTLYCDLTTSVFLLLVTFLFFCVFVYSYKKSWANRLYSFLFAVLEGLILLFFLSRDLFNVYVAVEVATIVGTLLITFKRESRSIYDGLIYLLVNIAAMLFFLLGVGILYRQFGVLDMSVIKAQMAGVSDASMLLPFSLIMTGACLKCALFPFHFWLPYAHGTPGAPTAVSAILSGLYVKGGVYLMLRMQDMFSPAIGANELFLWMGIFTAIAGIVMAVCQKDVKLILAYHTVSQMGLIVAGLNMGNAYSASGAMLHIFNHAMFKTLLFLTSGVLIDMYKTRNVHNIRGLMSRSPLLGFAVIAGILGITGAPLFNGSISKYLIQSGGETLVIEVLLLIINFGTALSFVKFGEMLSGTPKEGHSPNVHKLLPTSGAVITVLAIMCLVTGIFAQPVIFLLFGQSIAIDLTSYIVKGLVWLATMYAAYIFYQKVVAKIPRIKEGVSFHVGFNSVCMWLVSGFASIVAFTYLLTSAF